MTTPNQDPNSWLMGGGTPSASFDTIGTTVQGSIVAPPVMRQQTDIQTGEPRTYANGDPMMQLVVQIQTTDRDPSRPDDDGVRALYVKANMKAAIAAALRAARATTLDVGGVLTVQYTGDGEQKQRGFNPPKLYAAHYQPPAQGQQAQFLGTQPQQPGGAMAPLPAPPSAPNPQLQQFHQQAPAQLPPAQYPSVQALMGQAPGPVFPPAPQQPVQQAPVDNSPEAVLRAKGIDPSTAFPPGTDLASIVALMGANGGVQQTVGQ